MIQSKSSYGFIIYIVALSQTMGGRLLIPFLVLIGIGFAFIIGWHIRARSFDPNDTGIRIFGMDRLGVKIATAMLIAAILFKFVLILFGMIASMFLLAICGIIGLIWGMVKLTSDARRRNEKRQQIEVTDADQ